MTNLLALGAVAPSLPEDGSAWVADTARLIGDVRLGRNVGVWYGSVLRGDNEPLIIGDNTNLQEMVMLHTDMGFPLMIGSDCTIGHKALLHGCTIGNNTLIGMGAMVMNGARIGDNCIIGAGAIVTEGKEIADGSLVFGAPAKFIRAVRPEEIEGIAHSAAHYVDAMNRIKREARSVSRG